MSAWYNKGKQRFAQGVINWDTADIRCVLIDTDVYTFDAAHEFLSSVTGQVGAVTAMAGRNSIDGNLGASNTTVTAVSGATVEAVAVCLWVTSAADSPVLFFIDGLTLTPNGSDVQIVWPTTGVKIARL
jgi:hypothetical protein